MFISQKVKNRDFKKSLKQNKLKTYENACDKCTIVSFTSFSPLNGQNRVKN